MKSEDLIKALGERPVNPFVLHVDEVTSYYVPSPKYVAQQPGSGFAVVVPLVGGKR